MNEQKEKMDRSHRDGLWDAQEVAYEKMPWDVRVALVDMMDTRLAREDMIDRVLKIRKGVEDDMTVQRAAYGLCDNMLKELGYVECLQEEGESKE